MFCICMSIYICAFTVHTHIYTYIYLYSYSCKYSYYIYNTYTYTFISRCFSSCVSFNCGLSVCPVGPPLRTVITFIILILIHSYLVVSHHVFPSIVVWVCAPLDNPCGVCVIFLHKMQEIRNTVDDIAIWRKTLDTQFMFSVRIS